MKQILFNWMFTKMDVAQEPELAKTLKASKVNQFTGALSSKNI